VLSEQPGCPEVAAIPDLRVSRPELRLVRRNPQIACETYSEPRAHREAFHCRDGYLRDVVEQPAQLLHLTQPVDFLLESLAVILSHRRNVSAGAKRAACAGDHYASDFRILRPGFQRFY